ncbi:MAG: L,D-transpeptidase [Acidimicrobiia bacterium]|nr:L,D-transpeptidase [Acidimicrobiia bacterium]
MANTRLMARSRWSIPALLLVVLADCGQAAPDLPLYRAMAARTVAPTPTTTVPAPQVMAQEISRGPALWPVVEPGIQLAGPPYTVADVVVPRIGVYDSPTAPTPLISMSNKTDHGLQRVFLVAGQDGNRFKVLLPVRPNGSVGWVNTSDLDPYPVTYWIRVSTSAHTITVGNAGQIVLQQPVAVGTGGTPTPLGTFYLTELVRPIWQPYLGPYAYTTSAHSDVLYSFMGGDGVVGLHGTDAPGSIGHAVSHGCIRMNNAGITTLAGILPLGTPLFIGP